jgi:hypothetical protein
VEDRKQGEIMIKEENPRRTFFKKAAATMGVVVAAAASAKTLISASGSANGVREKYANDAALQEKRLSQSQLVMMTDEEKKQRLDQILGCHEKELG